MTAQLTFNLPEESAEHQMALDGWKWKSLIEDVLHSICEDLKHNVEKLTTDQQKNSRKYARIYPPKNGR